MTIMVTISSHIWWISLNVLIGNFITLNFPLLELFGCKLSSIFEIVHTILVCDVENGTKRKNHHLLQIILVGLEVHNLHIFHIVKVFPFLKLEAPLILWGFHLWLYTPLVHIFVWHPNVNICMLVVLIVPQFFP